MSKVIFDGQGEMPELNRITAKKNYASSSQSHKMGATAMFNDLLHYLAKEKYPTLLNEVGGLVAVRQHPVYAFQKIKKEGKDEYIRRFIGLFTVGADKGDKNYFGFTDDRIKDKAIRLEGTDHIKGVGFNYPYRVNGVRKIRYNHAEESLCIVTGSDKTKWTKIWEQSFCGDKKTEAEIEAYLDEKYMPAYEIVYNNNPLLVGVDMTINDINDNIDAFGKLRRAKDDRQYSYCEFWIDGEYEIYYLDAETNKYEKNGINLLTDLGISESELSGLTIDEKNDYFINKRVERFKTEWGNYFCKEDAIYQLAFLFIICASDNFEKNMYPYLMDLLWRFFQDDLDSIFSTDNQGQDTKSYSAELHDFTDASKSAYVFKGEDSAFWQLVELACPAEFKQMGYDILQAMYDLAPSGTTTTEKLMSFFDEYFFSKAQDYFPCSVYNNDTEYSYEEAWNNKEYVASVDINPLAQALGSHESTERAWLERRIIYLMSKFGFGGFTSYNDTALGVISVRTQDAQSFTLTPAIDMYPAVLGGQAQISSANHRVRAGEAVTLPAVGGNNTNVYIVGADWLSDIGDLKDLKIDPSSVVTLSIASKRLRRLKIGDENAQEVTSYLASLAIQRCDSMESVDARNLQTLIGTVDLSQCPRLIEALFGGTNTMAVIIAAGSKIERLELPDSTTTIDLRDTKFLEDFNINTLANVRFLRLENVPIINAFGILKEAYNTEGQQLKDIRLVGFTYNGNATDLDMIANLATDKDKDGNEHHYNGIDSNGLPDANSHPVLEGNLNIDGYVYEETADIVRQYYPTIEFTPKGYYIKFQDPEVLRVLLANGVGDGVGLTTEDIEGVTNISTWFKGNTVIKTFDEFERFTRVVQIGPTNYDGRYAFQGCTSLTSIKLPEGINILGSYSFNNCSSLTKINLPESITMICAECFNNSAINNEISLPNLQELKQGAFAKTNITKVIDIGNVTSFEEGSYDTSCDGSYRNVFSMCKSLTKVVLPDTFEIIGRCAFAGCSALVDINIPISVTNIDYCAFYNCTSLSFDELNLPNLTSLGQNAFYGVKIRKLNLGKLTSLPNASSSTQNYGDKDVLEEIIVPESVTAINNSAFYGYVNTVFYSIIGSVKTEGLYLPNLTGTIGIWSFNDTKITKILSLGNITGIGEETRTDRGPFKNCSLLERVVLPQTLTSIGGGSFYGCTALKEVVWSEALQYINLSAFWGAPIEGTLNLPNLLSISKGAFQGAHFSRVENLGQITSLDGDNDYNSFGVFWNCSYLEYIRIPSTVTSIGAYALRNCASLKTIICDATTPPSLGSNAFSGSKIASGEGYIYVPDASVDAYKAATNWSTYAGRIKPLSEYTE